MDREFFKASIRRRVDELFAQMADAGIVTREDYLAKLDPCDNDYVASFDDVILHPLYDALEPFDGAIISYKNLPEPYWFVDGPKKSEMAEGYLRMFNVTQAEVNALYALSNEANEHLFDRRQAVLDNLAAMA